MVLIVVAAVVAALVVLPVRQVEVERRYSGARQTGVDTLDLDFTADVANIDIAFEDLTGEWQSPSVIIDLSIDRGKPASLVDLISVVGLDVEVLMGLGDG